MQWRTADRVAAFTIVVAVFAAALWALYFPVFAAPDEDNHYDYVLTLRSAGRPIFPPEGPPQNDAHPVVRHLLAASGGVALRFDPLARLPEGYGTRAYWRAVDATAPRIAAPWNGDGRISPVPYLVRAYPIGYYAAAAAVVALSDLVAPGSVTAEFFAARLFSVGLFAITLVLWWRTFRYLDMPPWAALAVLFASAFTPVMLQTFSSVQPDCLVAALIAAIGLATCSQLKLGPTTGGVVVLSLLMALLCITKHHYFVAALLPSAAALVVAARMAGINGRSIAFGAAALMLPSIAGWLVTSPLMRSTAPGLALCITAQPRPPLMLSLLDTLRALPHHAVLYTESALLGGESMRRFWLAFGWYMEPVVLISKRVTTVVLVILGTFTSLIAALTAVELAKTFRRIAVVWRSRSLLALSFATRNVPAKMFLLYALLLLLALAYTDSSITLQGRYWVPFVPVIWYLAFWIAPRAIAKHTRLARAITIGGVAFTIVIALMFTPQSVAKRYFDAPASQDGSQEVYGAFEVGGKRFGAADLGHVRRGEPLHVRGIAVDLRSAAPVSENELSVDGQSAVLATPGARPGFACDFVTLSFLHTGFSADIPTAGLAPGPHRISLSVRPAWSASLLDTGTKGTFVVDP
jgi:hypothetical protein